MSNKNIQPWVKTALEMGPVILFFIFYSKLKNNEYVLLGETYEGFIVATALFIPVLLIATAILYFLTGKLSKMQVFTAVLVVVFGGLGIWFNDEKFFKMKPTMIYLLFGGILGFGLFKGQSYLQVVMDGALPMSRDGWMILTKRFMYFFFGLALANEIIWRSLSTDIWVNFKTFGLPLAMFVFFITQAKVISKYSTEND
ncbi:septation protein IspZ [Amylibacter sp.]|jgi:intracellular septation protein|nr:septation protein IspZ [Rhodobacterales bacterium]MDA7760388.1 septation protein IspZ [Amylibacter sp.]MBT4471372.1 septation protein IspZ [Rhodobacterales bacterium]MBT6833016.1 septation protein IspZ [Rhodobacterales bacterium]MBT6894283.1 septation protein IspZ [Rhodobacterales bacterium]|tara:strand:- start:3 stop:599 length:597 start_codon:yes stop_codon:yes gene_type:complete